MAILKSYWKILVSILVAGIFWIALVTQPMHIYDAALYASTGIYYWRAAFIVLAGIVGLMTYFILTENNRG